MAIGNSLFRLYEDVYSGIKSFVDEELKIKYPDIQVLKNVISSTYPQIVIKDENNPVVSQTSRNEITVRSPQFELNIYAKNNLINGVQMEAEDIVEDIADEVVYYLEKICGIKNINVNGTFQDFDSKNELSQRIVIRFTLLWIREYNIIY